MSRRELLISAAGLIPAAGLAALAPPNIIIILCDDLGYGDLSCYGGANRTPNIDRMAAEGMRFTQHLSANPVCSPSRAALLTGRYPTRVGVPIVLRPTATTGLPDSETTLAQTLKTRGYSTYCVGKWHLGHLPQYLPRRRGFDGYFGIPYSNDMSQRNNPNPIFRSMQPLPLVRDEKTIEEEPDQRFLTERYTKEALAFIERSKGSPFFLYMPHTFPHVPLYSSPRFRGKSPLGLYGDVVSELDWSVGEIFSGLKNHGLDRNTLVIFTSDNGPWFQGSPGRLRGRKTTTLEGGVRVPFLARYPGRIPAGSVSSSLTSMMDFFPTVARLCGAPLPEKPLDGIDIWPLLAGSTKEPDREALLYFDGWYLQCARLGRWKLHLTRYNSDTYSELPAGGRKNYPLLAPELYDVLTDVDESYDVAAEHPDVVEDMLARVERMLPTFPQEVRQAWAETQARRNADPRAGAAGREIFQ
jgi:arylsulfatase A